MNTQEFLASVLPDEGYLIVATPIPIPNSTQTAWRNTVVDDIPAAISVAAAWLWEGRDVYMALASFKERKVWNATKEKWERRTQANVQYLRSLYLDLDVKPGKDGHYQSQEEAIAALRGFCADLYLPKPTLVSSGYGVHAYWPLAESATRAEWKPAAEKLKSCCTAYGLLADAAVTADEARVLRMPGTANFKRGAVALVEVLTQGLPHDLAELHNALSSYVRTNNIPVASSKAKKHTVAAAGPTGFDDNLGTTNDPLNAGMLSFMCPAFGAQVAARGAHASEPQWYASIGLAKFCEPQQDALLAVSDGYPGFALADMQQKARNWTGGPPTCATFWHEDKDTCEGCPHWRNIKSPAGLGRALREVEPIKVAIQTAVGAVDLPPPPGDYVRTTGAHGETIIAVLTEDAEGVRHKEVICPYDFYPRRVLRQTNVDDTVEERSVWIVNLPRMGETEIRLPQAILSDTRKLHAHLLAHGMHLNANEAKSTQFYMSAYLKELSRLADREKVYDRLGWHDQYTTFVTPRKIYSRDGTIAEHAPSQAMRAITKDAIFTKGTLEAARENLKFLCGAGREGYRTFMYANFAAPLLNMTGHKGLLIAASGDTGRGKTTLLEACASIWGNPEPLLVSGGQDGATVNATYAILGTYHSLPMFWDDTTEREPEEMRKFMINISQGKGKERMIGSVHDGKVVTWETIVLSSANTDDVHRVMNTGKDVDPHLMRMISVEFDEVDRSTEMKRKADQFRRGLRDNFGHAGEIYLAYITMNYDRIKKQVLAVQEKLDEELGVTSEERFWSAGIACMLVGGHLAFKLGLIPFDPMNDIEWIKAHVRRMRLARQQGSSTPADILDEFLNAKVTNTLVVSPKQASNLDNVVARPYGALLVRNEIDTGRVYIARTAFNEYCDEVKANFRKLENDLLALGIILRKDCHKVLGADTIHAMGQTRCWEIDLAKLRNHTKGV
jgi:Domain of unknown function (DUF927)